MTTKRAKLFGFWLPVYDEDSAREATKMGGLPVLLLGANVALFSWLEFSKKAISGEAAIVGLVVSVVLIVFAFRIRANRVASLPYLVALALIFFVVNAIFSFFVGLIVNGVFVGGVTFVVTMIVPIFATLLAVSGIRGWLWLRKNKMKMLF
jgi:heme/copper-type cytochrome/quinol oxidase subunit 4